MAEENQVSELGKTGGRSGGVPAGTALRPESGSHAWAGTVSSSRMAPSVSTAPRQSNIRSSASVSGTKMVLATPPVVVMIPSARPRSLASGIHCATAVKAGS